MKMNYTKNNQPTTYPMN